MSNLDFYRTPEILIVDDTPEHIHFAASILKQKKYRVRAITDGNNIYETLKSGLPDLILLDILMPGIDGFSICTSLKNDGRFSSIPIIFYTSVNDTENIVKGFEAGAQDYISKPVNPKEMLARIETHLSLKQKTDKLKDAYREIETFNHMISHDLKAPIWSVNKLVGYLSQNCCQENDDTKELISTILEKSRDSITLIDKYSELAKLSRTTINSEKLDTNELFQSLFEEVRKQYPLKEVTFTLADLPNIIGDRVLLSQAIFNILSNSMKFSQKKDIVEIEVDYKRSGGDYIFCVRDNGAGFEMSYAADIFNFFVRLHSRHEFDGTGTGLAIVKKIINLHGGKVWINGKVNEGASFYFTLQIPFEIKN